MLAVPNLEKVKFWGTCRGSIISSQNQEGAEGAIIQVNIQGYKPTEDPPRRGSLLVCCVQPAAVEERGEAVIYVNDIRSTE